MKRRWTITSRGLLLVTFPLVCQLIFVCTLCALLWRVQADLSREFRSKAIVSEIYPLGTELIESAGLTCSTSKLIDVALINDLTAQALGRLRRFDRMLTNNQAQLGHAAELKQAVADMFQFAQQCHAAETAGSSNAAALLMKEYQSSNRVQLILDQIISTENAKASDSPSRVRGAREHILRLLLVAVVLSAVLALGLGLLYATAIKRPLSRIRENSRLLAERKALLPVLSGTDELADLDRVLHHAANDVNEALSKERALIDYAADIICSLDEHAVFTAVNPFVRRMLNYAPEEMVGKSIYDVVASLDAGSAAQMLRGVSNEGETRVVELSLRKQDGTLIGTRWSCLWSAVERRFFCVVHDISEQKRIEDLKQDFVNMVTHDLRSPLTALFGSLKLIAAGAKGPVPPPVETEVNMAANNVSKLVMFVNDLLDFQKLRVGKMQINLAACDFEEIIDETVSFVQVVADSKRIDLRVPTGHWPVRCDKPKMLQTVTNLVSNALKFTPEGGTVSIDVKNIHQAVEVSVSDSGPGVPEEFRERIFEAFEQAPAGKQPVNVQGTGLGLAICKLIVEAHGGTIGIEPAITDRNGAEVPGSGSKFWFRISK